jgi:type III secretion system protein
VNLLSKLAPLKRRCAANQLRCEARLRTQEQRLAAIASNLEGIGAQIRALQQFLLAQRPQNSVLDRAAFFAYLIKQSVLRRQVQQLGIRRSELLEQSAQAEKEREKARDERIFWLRKQDKYQYWGQLYRRQERLAQLSREENETQEMTTWHRST